MGLGWKDIDTELLREGPWEDVSRHVRKAGFDGRALGQLWRFARECRIGDYVLYYDPPKKRVVLSRVTSDLKRRCFAPHDEEDIWQYREVDYPIKPIPLLDFYAPLKGQLLGPRMSFWEVRDHDVVDQIARGGAPHLDAASDPELSAAFGTLGDLLLKRAEGLDATDWEWLAVDYFKAQGAHVDERQVGGSRAIIDAEARFDHGELGEEVWRIQVKRNQLRRVDWPEIEDCLGKVGAARLCFVSVYGFSKAAHTKAEEFGVTLMEARDFIRFLLSGKLRPELQRKLQLPLLHASR